MKSKVFRVTLLCMAALVNLCAGCGRTEEAVLNLGEETSVNSLINPEETVQEETKTDDRDTPVCVYVCGAVVSPGVYELNPGSRIYEAVNLAGGITEDADEPALNQAERISDGQMIYVPFDGEDSAGEKSMHPSGENAGGLVNINTADIGTLMTLNGVGESRARSIVAYREENGGFRCAEDIMKVTGIKEGLYEKIKGQITVN